MYFNGTSISTFFALPSSGDFPIIFIIDFTDTEFAKDKYFIVPLGSEANHSPKLPIVQTLNNSKNFKINLNIILCIFPSYIFEYPKH